MKKFLLCFLVVLTFLLNSCNLNHLIKEPEQSTSDFAGGAEESTSDSIEQQENNLSIYNVNNYEKIYESADYIFYHVNTVQSGIPSDIKYSKRSNKIISVEFNNERRDTFDDGMDLDYHSEFIELTVPAIAEEYLDQLFDAQVTYDWNDEKYNEMDESTDKDSQKIFTLTYAKHYDVGDVAICYARYSVTIDYYGRIVAAYQTDPYNYQDFDFRTLDSLKNVEDSLMCEDIQYNIRMCKDKNSSFSDAQNSKFGDAGWYDSYLLSRDEKGYYLTSQFYSIEAEEFYLH